MAKGRYRAPDPLLQVHHKFVFRRIAGDAEKIELGDNAGAADPPQAAAGDGIRPRLDPCREPAQRRAIRKDLDKRPRGWLNEAAATAASEVRRDFREWKKNSK